MKKLNLVMIMVAVVLVGAVVACKTKTESPASGNEAGETFTAEEVKRGTYLVNAIGCDDCHSPKVFGPHGPEVDSTRRFSGRPSNAPLNSTDTNVLKSWVLFAPDLTAFAGPWGVSFSANITSDETGIGNWNFAQFRRAIREGKYKGLEGSRPLLPPMPWPQYRYLTDEDLRSIFAFLKSTKPVHNVVPAAIPPAQAPM